MQSANLSRPLQSKDSGPPQNTITPQSLQFTNLLGTVNHIQTIMSKMVMSSFLTSAVISIAQLANGFGSAGLMPVIILTGTVSGSAGVFVVYLSWIRQLTYPSLNSREEPREGVPKWIMRWVF